MRRNPELIAVEEGEQPWRDAYGISIRVIVPPGRTAAPAGILESVVDGCLASFHRDADLPRAARVAAKLATQLRDTDEGELSTALTGSGPLLFAGPPFRHFPTFVQLSPCDELCLLGSLEMFVDVHAVARSLSGELFGVERAA
jgi:hypothetical protein